MVLYRRYQLKGGTYFFTVTLQDRSSSLLVDQIHLLRQVMNEVQAQQPWETTAVVVMPDHLHAVWTLPEGDCDFSSRWKSIKSGFVRRLRKQGHAISYNGRGEAAVWQSRFWEHAIRDEDDLRRHIDYIHYNPVRHGLVSRAADWPWSSFHRYVRQGVVGEDWGVDVSAVGEFGE